MTITLIQSLNTDLFPCIQKAHRISKGEESPTEAISGIVKYAFANCEQLGKYKWVNNVTARIMYWCARFVLSIDWCARFALSIKGYSANDKFTARLALDVLFRATLCMVDLRNAVAKNKDDRLIAATAYGGTKEVQHLLTKRLASNQTLADTRAEIEQAITKHKKALSKNPFTAGTTCEECVKDIQNILEERSANEHLLKRIYTRIKEAGASRAEAPQNTLLSSGEEIARS